MSTTTGARPRTAAAAEPPARLTALWLRLPRWLRHEWTLAALAAIAIGVYLNRGALADPSHTLPEDVWDPSLVAYLIAWDGHALLHNASQLWQINAFYPSHYGLAFSDSLLGYSPFGFFGSGPVDAVLRYNIVFTVAEALSFLGAYALVRQLGAGRMAAAVAGTACAMAPWRLGQSGHLHVISTGGIALALAMLARGHGLRLARRDDRARARAAALEGGGTLVVSRPPVRPGWAVAGWLVAAWQVTIGFGIGLVFVYVVLGCFVAGTGWWLLTKRPRPGWRLITADVVGGLVFTWVSVAMAQPYLKVLEMYPFARRTVDELAEFSPPLRGFVTAPPESVIWGGLHASSRALLTLPAEMDLLPGFMLYALASVGLIFSIWTVRARLLLLAGVVVSVALGLGTNGPDGGQLGYLWLFEHLPGFQGLRTPGRMIVWTTLLLAILAAGAVDEAARRLREGSAERAGASAGRLSLFARAALTLPLALVFVEGMNNTPHPVMPDQPASLSTVTGPYLVLPSYPLLDQHVMLWSTDGFQPVANGGSGFVPSEIYNIRKNMATFPDALSAGYLRLVGIHTVVVYPQLAPFGSRLAEAATIPLDAPGVTRTRGLDGAVIFTIS
jgi:hypothetical protein